LRSIVHFEDYYWFIVSRVVIPFPFVLFINACSHFSLSKKIIIFLSIFHLEHCALDISTRWNRTSMLFDFPYISYCYMLHPLLTLYWWTIGQLHCFQFYFIKIVFCGISGNDDMFLDQTSSNITICNILLYLFDSLYCYRFHS